MGPRGASMGGFHNLKVEIVAVPPACTQGVGETFYLGVAGALISILVGPLLSHNATAAWRWSSEQGSAVDLIDSMLIRFRCLLALRLQPSDFLPSGPLTVAAAWSTYCPANIRAISSSSAWLVLATDLHRRELGTFFAAP